MTMASRKRTSRLCICAVTAWAFGVSASAQEFELIHHSGSGGGSAQLFDGGDAVSGSFSNPGTDMTLLGYTAVDVSTQPGVLAAQSRSVGFSEITLVEDEIFIRVELDVRYRPSIITGGDNPGGMADGQLSSIIEFMMPVDEADWVYSLRIQDTVSFEGSTSVIMENVTQNQTLLSLTEVVFPPVFTTLSANAGDIIRITSEMEGFGSTGPAGSRRYSPIFQTSLLIPEPSTLLLFAPAALLMRRRTRRLAAAGRCGAFYRRLPHL